MSDRILTRQEMILLHLLQYIDVTPNGYTMPFAQTKDGIGMGRDVQILRGHRRGDPGGQGARRLGVDASQGVEGPHEGVLPPAPRDPEGEGDQRQAGGEGGSHRGRHRASGEHRKGREHRQGGHGAGAGRRIRQVIRG